MAIFLLTTGPKIDTIMKFGQFLHLEHISGKMKWALLWHLDFEFLEDWPPNNLHKMTDDR